MSSCEILKICRHWTVRRVRRRLIQKSLIHTFFDFTHPHQIVKNDKWVYCSGKISGTDFCSKKFSATFSQKITFHHALNIKCDHLEQFSPIEWSRCLLTFNSSSGWSTLTVRKFSLHSSRMFTTPPHSMWTLRLNEVKINI